MFALILVGLSLLNGSAFNLQSRLSANPVKERATIRRQRTVIVRSADIVKDFPHRKTATIDYPIITGLNPGVLLKVRALLSFKNIFDYSLAEYRTDPWLSEFSYVVNHNANSLLDITFTQSGLAAYPDEQSKHFLIDLTTGKLITATDAFEIKQLPRLNALVDAKLQQELAKLRKENAATADRDGEEKISVNEAYDLLRFESANLNDFSVTERGITFLYDAGFPHVIKALEPQGRYFFTYEELKPYIKSDGPLGQFVR